MKRLISLLLMVLLLTGCAFSGNQMKDPVTFYYPRSTTDSNVYDDFFAEGVIGSEIREASGYSDNLAQMLTVYFKGPLDQSLRSPYPFGCGILKMQQTDAELTLMLYPFLAE